MRAIIKANPMYTELQRQNRDQRLVWLPCAAKLVQERSVRVVDRGRNDNGPHTTFVCPECGKLHVSMSPPARILGLAG